MSEPTLQDCINYMRSQIKQMEKHPRSYEFNLPYYRKTVELLETRPSDETFEWCHDCKEYDKKNHCCHRWAKVIRDTVDELEKDRPHGEWIGDTDIDVTCKCSICRMTFDIDRLKMVMCDGKYEMPPCCPNCGADMRKEGEQNEVD